MYQYRIISRLANRTIRIAWIAASLVMLFLLLELLYLILIFKQSQPWIAGGLVLAVVAGAGFLALRQHVYRRDHRILTARGLRLGSDPGHAQLARHLKHLIHCIKRLTQSRLLTEEQTALIRQKAHDQERLFHHHPLRDDLERAIIEARNGILRPTFSTLGVFSAQVTRSKALAVIQDLYQPPFPILSPLVVTYHQITLISEIADIFIPNPSLREYIRVIGDVWQVMTKGDFIRFGQRLFNGINSNNYALGRAGEDLGMATSLVWLTHATAQAAAHRCCTLHDWRLDAAIDDMNEHLAPCLESTRHSLLQDALPVLKKRIRHYAPVNMDAETYVEEISVTFIKSVEAVVLALSAATARPVIARHTSPGLVIANQTEPLPLEAPMTPDSATSPERRRRRRHRRRHQSESTTRLGRLLDRVMRIGTGPRHGR